MKVVVTGGAGFIGSAVSAFPNYSFAKVDVCNKQAVATVFSDFQPDAVMHLAAESHVDRSIDGPADFIQTNVVGTFTLLEVARDYFNGLDDARKQAFRFHHVSTDEVYGSLGDEGLFTEQTAYAPNSPYSATKAGADHLVRAWHHTYGLPVIISNCSNNYGPYQFPEKLIPLMILNVLQGKKLPVYGDGGNTRDWLHVEDHAEALFTILTQGRVGEKYNVGGCNEVTNLDVVRRVFDTVTTLVPETAGKSFDEVVDFVDDRPGHDWRYAIDPSKMRDELGWNPKYSFETGLAQTVTWYVDHRAWWEPILKGKYAGQRLGRGTVQ